MALLHTLWFNSYSLWLQTHIGDSPSTAGPDNFPVLLPLFALLLGMSSLVNAPEMHLLRHASSISPQRPLGGLSLLALPNHPTGCYLCLPFLCHLCSTSWLILHYWDIESPFLSLHTSFSYFIPAPHHHYLESHLLVYRSTAFRSDFYLHMMVWFLGTGAFAFPQPRAS